MRKRIRLTESDLRRIVNKSVRQVLRESTEDQIRQTPAYKTALRELENWDFETYPERLFDAWGRQEIISDLINEFGIKASPEVCGLALDDLIEKYGYYADNFEEDDEEEGGYRRFRG